MFQMIHDFCCLQKEQGKNNPVKMKAWIFCHLTGFKLLTWHTGLNIHLNVLRILWLISCVRETYFSCILAPPHIEEGPNGGHGHLQCKLSWSRRRWLQSEPWCHSWRCRSVCLGRWPLETCEEGGRRRSKKSFSSNNRWSIVWLSNQKILEIKSSQMKDVWTIQKWHRKNFL